jgi:hypothetical protein
VTQPTEALENPGRFSPSQDSKTYKAKRKERP